MSDGQPEGGSGGDSGGGGGGGRKNGHPSRGAHIPSDLRKQMSHERLTELGSGKETGPGGTIASRPTYSEVQLEEEYNTRLEPSEKRAHKQNLIMQRRAAQIKEKRDTKTIVLGVLSRVFPCIRVFVTYRLKEYFIFDLISGISVGLFIIPQAIAFSLLANVQPQYGFYSAFFAMTIYFIFGTSKHLNMSSQGAVSLIVGEAVRAGLAQVYPNGKGLCLDIKGNSSQVNWTTTLATTASYYTTTFVPVGNDTVTAPCINKEDAHAQIAITITLIAGILQIVLGALQMGSLTIYLSDPLNSAFTCGAALHIVSSQLGNMLGAKIPPINGMGKFFLYFIEAFRLLFRGEVNWRTIIVCIVFFALLLSIKLVNEKCTKYVKIPIPIDIIVLIASLLLSKYMKWSENYGILDVGKIRKGFEPPKPPPIEHFTSGSGIIVNGIVLGVISYALSVSLAKNFGLRHGYEVDANQEVIAYGAVNFCMSWFSTFVSASSIACTSLHESMRGKTLLYSVYAAIITLIAILTFSPEFQPVPKCVLSGIILVNLKNMIMQVEQLPRLWRTNRFDFAIFLVTLGTILALDLPIGLLIGVIFSLLTIIYRTQAPKAYLLGRVPKTDIYKNVKKIKGTEEIPGLKIFKFDGSLYFASGDNFRRRLFRSVAMNPKKILARAKAHAKRQGDKADDLHLRTDVLNAEGIKEVLGVVKEEGSHPSAMARQKAQLGSTEELQSQMSELTIKTNESDDGHTTEEEDDDDKEPTVNVFAIIVDLSACAFIDAVGVRMLSKIVDDFNQIGVEIYLCGCTSLVRSLLRKANFFAKRTESGLFVTVHDAVIHALSTFYQELLEDESHSIIDDESGQRRLSVSQHGASDVARERRRRTRTFSVSQNAEDIQIAVSIVAQARRPSECIRHMETFGNRFNAMREDAKREGAGLDGPPPEYSQRDVILASTLRQRSFGSAGATGIGVHDNLNAVVEADGSDNQAYSEETRF